MPIKCNDLEYVDTAEAAALLDVSVARIRQLSDEGRIGDVSVYDGGQMRAKSAGTDRYRPSWYHLRAVLDYTRQKPGPKPDEPPGN